MEGLLLLLEAIECLGLEVTIWSWNKIISIWNYILNIKIKFSINFPSSHSLHTLKLVSLKSSMLNCCYLFAEGCKSIFLTFESKSIMIEFFHSNPNHYQFSNPNSAWIQTKYSTKFGIQIWIPTIYWIRIWLDSKLNT